MAREWPEVIYRGGKEWELYAIVTVDELGLEVGKYRREERIGLAWKEAKVLSVDPSPLLSITTLRKLLEDQHG